MKEFNNIYPKALINITNRCNLNCMLCFIFRDGNPNMPTKKNEIPAEEMIVKIKKLKKIFPFAVVKMMLNVIYMVPFGVSFMAAVIQENPKIYFD